MSRDQAINTYLTARRGNGKPAMLQAFEGQPYWRRSDGVWQRSSPGGGVVAVVDAAGVTVRGENWRERLEA